MSNFRSRVGPDQSELYVSVSLATTRSIGDVVHDRQCHRTELITRC